VSTVNSLARSGAEPQQKSYLVHFSLKIWHLVAPILLIFLRINWSVYAMAGFGGPWPDCPPPLNPPLNMVRWICAVVWDCCVRVLYVHYYISIYHYCCHYEYTAAPDWWVTHHMYQLLSQCQIRIFPFVCLNTVCGSCKIILTVLKLLWHDYSTDYWDMFCVLLFLSLIVIVFLLLHLALQFTSCLQLIPFHSLLL